MDSAVDFVSTRDTSTSSGSLEFEVVSFPACNNKLIIHIHPSPFSVARNQCHTLYLESGLCIGPFYAKVCYSSHLIGVFIMEEVFASNEPLRVRSLRPASIILLYVLPPSLGVLQMGLSGRKVKQRIGNDPRNLSWADGLFFLFVDFLFI